MFGPVANHGQVPTGARRSRLLLTECWQEFTSVDIRERCKAVADCPAKLLHPDIEYLMPSKRRLASVPFRDSPLTSEEFASLKEVGNRPMQLLIPDEHRDLLVAAGYIREVVRGSTGVSLVLTGRGMKRLARGE